MPPRLPVAAALLSLLVLAGCRDREITAYRAPKDPAPAAPPTASGLPSGAPVKEGADTMANTAVPTGGDSLAWAAPAHWTAKPPSAMRKGSYAVKDGAAEADLSITSFPGDTGGLLANVNRWRGQISLPPLAADQLDANREHIDIGPLHVDVVDFAGSANGASTRIIGAIVPVGGETWFFKLMGPDALVAKEKPAFLEFLRTVRPR
jgi:hypothetical protein